MQWVLLGGVLLINTFPQLLLIGIILFAATTLFSLSSPCRWNTTPATGPWPG
jgi:Zn-dependent membrane protease YugP